MAIAPDSRSDPSNHNASQRSPPNVPRKPAGLACPESGDAPVPADGQMLDFADTGAGIGLLSGGAATDREQQRPKDAATAFQDVTSEALGGHKTIASEAEPPVYLKKAFSLCEREDHAVDLGHLSTLQKVSLVMDWWALPSSTAMQGKCDSP